MRLTKDNVEVGMGVTQILWTDSHAYTVIKVSASKNVITLQRDKAIRITKPEFVTGGFSGICTNNNEIQYNIAPDSNGHIVRVTAKKNGEFHSYKNPIIIGRHEQYDYNF